MQKRLLLAFILSFLVLTVWGRLFPVAQNVPHAPEATPRGSEPALPAVSSRTAPEGPSSQIEPPPAPPSDIVEELQTAASDKIKATFSNVGGVLKEVELKEYNETLPVTDIIDIPSLSGKEFQLKERTGSSVVYFYKRENFEIQKIYELKDGEYLINANVVVYANPEMSKQEIQKFTGFSLDISRLDKKLKQSRDLNLIEYAYLISEKVYRKGNFIRYNKDHFSINKLHPEQNEGQISWVGMRNRYFAFLISPKFKTAEITSIPNKEKLISNIVPADTAFADNENYEFSIYVGPQKLDLLKKYDSNFDTIMKFSNFGLLDFVAKIIYKILNLMHKIVPNWGVCIIILGFLIYGITYPLTLKSMSSMKKMQSLQPKIAKLKEQYKNNPQKLSKEQMGLFKEHKINPMGGCLPVLLQMPIFIGFYQVLWRSVMLKGASFLWIKDLSQPDRLYVFSQELPFIGNELNLFPILMGIVMVFQQKLSAKNMNITDPAQASQQKMMMFFLPVMMILIFYHAASGLTLYFTFFYLLTTFTQWKISKAK